MMSSWLECSSIESSPVRAAITADSMYSLMTHCTSSWLITWTPRWSRKPEKVGEGALGMPPCCSSWMPM